MSTSTERFTTNCPSCDAGVAVKAALVGKKIECPKCKFRFVVPAQAGGEPAAPAKADKPSKSVKAAKALPADDAKGDPKGGKEKKEGKGKGKGKEKKEAKGGGNGKVIIGAVVGVIALIGLAFGAFLIFSKVSSNKETEAYNKQQQNNNNNGGGTLPITPGGGGTDPMTPKGPGDGDENEKPNPMTPGNGTTTPGGGTTTPPAPKPKKPRPSGVDITNLLPNDTTAVFHARMDDLDREARPLRTMVFDKATTDLFERAMNFPVDQITELVHGEVGAAQAPFAVFRTRAALDDSMLAQPKMDTSTADTVAGRQYRVVKRNAFLTAAEKSLGVKSILGPLLGFDLPAADTSKAKEITYAVCLYDANTLIVAERDLMQRYLGDLKENGLPEYITQYKEEVAPRPAPPAETPGGAPGQPGSPPGRGGPPPGISPPGSPGGPGGPPMPGVGLGGPPMPGVGPGGEAPGGSATTAPPRPKKTLTSNPTFLTVTKDLKKALNTLEDEDKDQPVAVYVTRVNTAQVSLLDLRTLKLEQIAIAQLLKDFKVLGVAVTRVTETRGSFAGYIEYASSDAAKVSVEQQLIPGLKLLLQTQLPAKLQPVSVLDLNDPNSTPNNPGGYPGGEGPGYPGGAPGYPGGSPGYPGGGGPGSGPSLPPTPGGGRGERGPEASAPQQGGPNGSEDNAQGPPPMPPAPPGGPGPPPGGPGGPGRPGGPPGGPGYPGPGFPGGEGGGPGTQPSLPSGNTIGVSRDGAVVTLTGEFNWKEDVFKTVVEPIFDRHGAVVRGKLGMYSGEAGLFALAAKPKDGKPAGGVIADAFGKDTSLPQGALARAAKSDDRKLPGTTAGLPYQPEQRCSFFAELTRYMGNKGTLPRNIDPNQAWYSKPNLDLAETWIPELLVSDYPQTAWRATSELIPDGRSVGATNFVGVAGVGLDAARLDPKKPDDAKKAGMTGYDFASKPEDVKDGLGNTIYLIQVPPTYQRPWMAGGGATLQGVNEKGNDPARPFMVKKADGSRGTMVLMGDGSVRYVKEGIDPAAFRAMATRAGGETIADLDKVAPPAANPALPGELKAGK